MPKKDRAQDEGEDVGAAEELQDQSAKPEAEAAAQEGLVKMRKGEETLHVHPTTVKAHQAAGWSHA